ncbi:glycosyltransferase [Streptomyces sp. ISL-100]|uniref:glycosyltransferase n=1 Tax=Streptomyces sp. ISL-100 TaxID=2819173 RepID=UPI001BECB62A|nr:glycosyltransferase [Streptomyces sp. ISL-100]MBT2396497.1 glycosyltransferase [Streptomyces sp. ISL-100]
MLQRSWAGQSQLTVFHLVQPVEGGVARVVTDLVRAQTREGLRTVVACPPGGALATEAAEAGAYVHTWPAVRAPGPTLAGEVMTAARLIRQSRPHVVHAHSAKAGLAGRLAVRGRVPTVFQPHAWSFEAVQGREAALALKWEQYGTRWSSRTLCVSETERKTGEEAGIAARWSVIRNGIDLRHFRPDEGASRAPARAALPLLTGMAAGTPLVLCVGRLCRQKGQDILLRAWQQVAPAVPGATLVLVGDGPDRDRLMSNPPPGVLFAGAIRDPRPWFHAADIVVLPSRWEGMALAPLEAMACGRPVVLTDVAGARESLPPGHEAHCLVPPEDPAALGAALTQLLNNPGLRDALGRAAQSHTRSTRDVRDTAAAVCGLYRELLSLHRPMTRRGTER